MILLIDGYNVLKSTGRKEISEQERAEFIARVDRYAVAKGHVPIIVFDAGSSSMIHRERHDRVEIVYTGYKTSADDYIKEYVTKHAGKNILVISADRELGRKVSNGGALIMDPHDFLAILKEELSNSARKAGSTSTRKTALIADEMVDVLMQEAAKGNIMKGEHDQRHQDRTRPAQTMSKEEKRLLRKIKKL